MPSNRRTAIQRSAVAVSVYLLAVFHRTSLGVAGLQASDRFGINAAQLSVFVLLQLGVYAAMQIPTGVLVDRYGPRRLLVAAASLMGLAQLLFALVDSYPLALLARAMLGCGDALTFVSVLRFAGSQFAPARYPVVVAMAATVGTAGNVVATLPLSSALHAFGWTPTFLVAAGLSVVSGALVFMILPSSRPAASMAEDRTVLVPASRTVRDRVRLAWSMPGTRLGFWIHFSTMSTSLMVGVLWGVPFMVRGQGFSRSAAGTVLLAGVLFGLAVNPGIGYLISRRAYLRTPIAVAVSVLTIAAWAVALSSFGSHIPSGVLIAVVVFTGVGAPISGISFSVARDYNSPALVGTATGVVNVGGFLAGTAGCLIVGWVLDHSGTGEADSFRWAFAAALCVQLAGLLELLRWWRRSRAFALAATARGEAVPVPVVRRWWDLN